MTLSSALSAATSGLHAAQAGLRTISDNIANVNTPGYVRKAIDQTQRVVDGRGVGVQINGVRRVTDQYLQLASLSAASDASKWSAVSQYLDNAQSLFGDPSGDGFFFNRLDDVLGAFATAADDPSSSLVRAQALSNVEDLLSEAGRINTQVTQLGKTMESRISADVDQANGLLEQIEDLNNDISRAKVLGADASGSENIQSGLVDQLAGLLNVRVTARDGGGVTVRSDEGQLLAGDGYATLKYNSTDTTRGYISAIAPGSGTERAIRVSGGEIQGLIELRDDRLPKIAEQLGEFMSRAVESLNAAHNAASAVPAPNALTGRATGVDLPTGVTGFTGAASVAIVNNAGVVQQQVDINFTAGTMSNDGGVTNVAFTPATFLATLNGRLTPAMGAASFSANGTLSITAAGATNGVAISEGTSDKGGKAFSHFFGLNDLIRSTAVTNYDTGLTTGSPHGFIPGGQITLRIAQADGRPIQDVTVTVPPAGSNAMSDLLTALNAPSGGVGLYGSFGLDARGVLAFTPSAPTSATVAVMDDDTQRTLGGTSLSEFFGVGVRDRTARANRFQVDPTINSDPTRLALATLDLTVAPGQPALRPGDGTGALAIAGAGDIPTLFAAAGDLGSVTMTISRYGAEFGGAVGRGAAAAETRKGSADAVQNEATARRQSVEGVNLDEELVNLTTYQQAFNASARMIQAAKDMYDVLLGIV